jgi:hypothetical protein
VHANDSQPLYQSAEDSLSSYSHTACYAQATTSDAVRSKQLVAHLIHHATAIAHSALQDHSSNPMPGGRGRGRGRGEMRIMPAPGTYPPYKRDGPGAGYPTGMVHVAPEGAMAPQSPDHPPTVGDSVL